MDRQSGTGRRASTSSDASPDPETTESNGTEVALSRRKIVMRAAGVAAAGAVGGSVLTQVSTSPALAAEQGTTVEQGAVAPTVVFLTDAATIAVDASLGNDFRVTINTSRDMGNPSNPTDGQQIVFQITQGPAGSSTITWGSSYEFSKGLPEPTLSTAAGQTDRLIFIYNAARGTWLLAAFVNGFGSATTPPPPPPKGYRLFPSTNGPSTPGNSYQGDFISGMAFFVTGEAWLEGYWWWCCNSGQNTTPVKFALWQQPAATNTMVLVPGSVATSGTLTAGAWSYIPLSTPLLLSLGTSYSTNGGLSGAGAGCVYVAAVGVNGPFPDTQNQFGAGQPYAAGITNGPLSAYSNSGLKTPYASLPSSTYSVGGSDPSTTYPDTNPGNDDNLWIDVQVSNTAPAGTSYRLWPNYPQPAPDANIDTGTVNTGTEFRLSQPCTLDKIWLYSPSGAVNTPQRVGIWDVTTKTEVPGTDNSSPIWLAPGGGSASPGSGWIYVDYSSSGITLPAGDYKVAMWNGLVGRYYTDSALYFNPGTSGTDPGIIGAGGSGITYGPLSSPNVPNAADAVWDDSSGTKPGNSTYQNGAWAYPDTFEVTTDDTGETRWLDVEVTPT